MNKAAKITVLYDKIRNHKICPYIFGNFVEDIRDHMDAMLSYIVKDMDFEEEDYNGDGVSDGWYPITNGKNTIFELEPAAPLHSGHSQKIRIISADNCYAGIGQRISVKGNMEYRIRIYARATAEISHIKLEIMDSCRAQSLGSTVIQIDSHRWKEYTASIFIEEDCNDAEFRLTINVDGREWFEHMTKGNLWIDHVSMLPADSVGNVKKEVVDMARDLNCGMMRLGGNEISCYHWQDGVGPEYLRPNRKSEAWGHWTNKYFGTDEFISFCKNLGVEPLICVNAGSGTPEEAAQWVEYCNGSIDTPMGKLRAENGHPEPYNVKYWEIGNEIYGPWQTGHCTAEEFAKRIIEFHKAMKKVDQNIILLGCGHVDPEWNRTILDIAGEYIDYITLHIYHSYRRLGISEDASRDDKFKGMVCYPEVSRACINAARDIIKSNSKYAHVKLAITEYNTMYYPNNIRKGLPNEHTLEAAVANAANLNEFLRNSDIIDIGNFSDLVNGWLGGCIRVGDNYVDQKNGRIPGWSGKSQVVYGTPTYYVLKMYANRDIAYIVDTNVECDTFDVSYNKTENLADRLELSNLPVLDVVSCVNENKDTVTLFVVNRSMEDLQIQIDVIGSDVDGPAKLWELSGSNIDAINDVFNPENIVPKYFNVDINNKTLCRTFKAHSVNVLELKCKLSK